MKSFMTKITDKASAALPCLVVMMFSVCLNSCHKMDKGEPVYTFNCTANEQIRLTGANDWYDKMKVKVVEDDSKFQFIVPGLYQKVVQDAVIPVGETPLTEILSSYPLGKMTVSVENKSGSIWKKSGKKCNVEDSDTKIRVEIDGGSHYYSIKLESGFVKLRFLDGKGNSRPRFTASFDLNLLVRVKTSANGELIESFPLRLSNGVMSYR